EKVWEHGDYSAWSPSRRCRRDSRENDPMKGIVSWATLVQWREEQTGEKVMESIKKSVRSRGLVPNKVREHLLLNATRFTTLAVVRTQDKIEGKGCDNTNTSQPRKYC
ncbi:unnamed protein product, partial [Prorocentrum cordatum]